MEVLYITEAEVDRLLTIEVAIEAVETAFRSAASGAVETQPRRRLLAAASTYLHYMAARDDASGYAGLKVYTSSNQGVRFLVPLFCGRSGQLVALLEADRLGCLRTGAASGVATKHMARIDATRVALLGTGHQAPTQLHGVARVRSLTSVAVYSRDAQRRRAFAKKMSAELPFPIEAVDSAEACVGDADIVIVVTSSKSPVLEGRWLAPGAHVNAVGANFPQKRELDDSVIARVARIVVDSKEQSKEEAGDLIVPFAEQPQLWNRVHELAEVVAGKYPGRVNSGEITLFKSNGVALEDVAVAARVYERARKEGLGRTIRMWE
jgi:ornithine cyclodeaminase/alanine dehydrogenase-like protein (mu-crystallin family)